MMRIIVDSHLIFDKLFTIFYYYLNENKYFMKPRRQHPFTTFESS